jgi:arylformamidase
MFVRLSHVLDEHQPNWPDSPGLSVEPVQRIANGDNANTNVLHMYTHYGTHVDVPWHFLADGPRLDHYGLEQFVYERPAVVDLPLGPDQLVQPADLARLAPDIARADAIVIRSGFEAHRDEIGYQQHGPGFSAAAARHLREHHPDVKAILLDWLSLCALQCVDEGMEAHRTLLRPDAAGRVCLIFEDVKVSALAGQVPKRILALPLFIRDLDGSPCTVVAEV